MNETYRIGQMRRQQFSMSDFEDNLADRISIVEVENTIEQASITFTDFGIALNKDGYISTETYYVRVKIKRRADGFQAFEIKLQQDADAFLEEPRTQHIRNIVVPQKVSANEDEYDYFEFIFSPNSQYNKIVFVMSRDIKDFYLSTNDKPGRFMDLTVDNIRNIKNILMSGSVQSYYPELSYLRKIGIQGDPGLLFTVNGEEMHLGRSGFYELHDDNIPVEFLGFVIKDLPITITLPAKGADDPPKTSLEEWRDTLTNDTTGSDSRDHEYVEKVVPHTDNFIVDFKY